MDRQTYPTTPPVLDPLEPRRLLAAFLDLIGATDLRADPATTGFDGAGYTVAVLDTGLDVNHPALAGAVVAARDFTAGAGGDVTDNSGHGTHVSGIALGRPEGTFTGGVAPGASVAALKVLDVTRDGGASGSNADIERALVWVQENAERLNIVAVNMSLGGGLVYDLDDARGDILADDVRRLEERGIAVVSAAGNSYRQSFTAGTGADRDGGRFNTSSPGIFSSLNVGAVWEADDGAGIYWGGGTADLATGPDRITSFSQRPPDLGNVLFAPGALIRSADPGGGYFTSGGTSQAAPVVAGAVAVVQDAAETLLGQRLGVGALRDLLMRTAASVTDGDDERAAIVLDADGDGRYDDAQTAPLPATGYSYKRLDLAAAVRSLVAQAGDPDGPVPDQNAILATATPLGRLDATGVRRQVGEVGRDGVGAVGRADVDLYAVDVAVPGTFEVVLDPEGFQGIVRVFDTAGTALAAGFDSAVVDVEAGTYVVGVSGSGNGGYDPADGGGSEPSTQNGTYALTLDLSAGDPNGTFLGAVDVALGGYNFDPQQEQGFLGADRGVAVGSQDVDIFKVVAPDDGTVTVDIDTPDRDGFADTYVRAFDDRGLQVAAADDALAPGETAETSGHATDSYLTVPVGRGRAYYVAVSDWRNQDYDPFVVDATRSGAGDGGTYRIEVDFFNNDRNGAIPQAVEAGGGSLPLDVAGTVGTDGGADVGNRDVDFLTVRPEADGWLDVTVAGRDGFDALLSVYDDAGDLLARIDNVGGSDGLDPAVTLAVEAGTYHVAVSGAGNDSFDPYRLGSGNGGDSGAYDLSAELLPLAATADRRDDAVGDGGVGDLAPGGRAVGDLGRDGGLVIGDGDVDLYRLTATFTGTLEVRADGVGDFPADTYLRVFDAAGTTELAANDDSGDGTDSLVTLDVTDGATYLVGVHGTGSGADYDPAVFDPGRAGGDTGQYVVSAHGNAFATLDGDTLTLAGTDAADTIAAEAAGGRIALTRNGQTVTFADGPSFLNIDAGGGDDRVTLGEGLPFTYVFGGDGDDVIQGGPGRDTLSGGAGRNTIYGGDGPDRLNGSGGRDLLFGEAGHDRLYGRGGNDNLDGGGGIDRLFAGAGDDYLDGGSSADKLYGGPGADTLYGAAGPDWLVAGPGRDLLGGNDGDDSLFALDDQPDTLTGGTGDDLAEIDDEDLTDGIESTV